MQIDTKNVEFHEVDPWVSIHPYSGDFLGQQTIPLGNALGDPSMPEQDDIMAVVFHYTNEPEDNLHIRSIDLLQHSDGRAELVRPADLSAEQLHRSAPALLPYLTLSLGPRPLAGAALNICSEDDGKRGVVAIFNAHAALVLTSEDDYYDAHVATHGAIRENDLDGYMRLLTLPAETAHEAIAIRPHIQDFLKYYNDYARDGLDIPNAPRLRLSSAQQ